VVQLALNRAPDQRPSLVAFFSLEQQIIVICKLMSNRGDHGQENRFRIKPLCCRRTTNSPAGFNTSMFGNASGRLGRATWKVANDCTGKRRYELMVEIRLPCLPSLRLAPAPISVRQTLCFGPLDCLGLGKNPLALISFTRPAPLKNDGPQLRIFEALRVRAASPLARNSK
jgi:hypothetical protein